MSQKLVEKSKISQILRIKFESRQTGITKAGTSGVLTVCLACSTISKNYLFALFAVRDVLFVCSVRFFVEMVFALRTDISGQCPADTFARGLVRPAQKRNRCSRISLAILGKSLSYTFFSSWFCYNT